MATGLLSRLGQLKHCNHKNVYEIIYHGKVQRDLKTVGSQRYAKGEINLEYIFGADSYNGVKTLLTKGDEHTDLNGFTDTVREYEDSTIIDSFRIVRKTDSKEDADGNCYDWYVIDQSQPHH